MIPNQGAVVFFFNLIIYSGFDGALGTPRTDVVPAGTTVSANRPMPKGEREKQIAN